MTKRNLFFTLAACCILAFGFQFQSWKPASEVLTPVYDKTIALEHGFEVHFKRKLDVSIPKLESWYEWVAIALNGKVIAVDSVSGPFGAELGLMNGMKKYPMLVSAGERCFEIILLCRRPEFPAGLAFRILDGKLAGKQRVSYFYHPNAANLDSDAAKEFAGEFNMDPAAKPNTIYYNPILYYELRETGIALDSAFTIEKNKAIFGRFLGYDFILNKAKKDKGGKMRAARAAELKRIESLQ